MGYICQKNAVGYMVLLTKQVNSHNFATDLYAKMKMYLN